MSSSSRSHFFSCSTITLLLSKAASIIRADKRRWMDFMMRFELGLEEPASVGQGFHRVSPGQCHQTQPDQPSGFHLLPDLPPHSQRF